MKEVKIFIENSSVGTLLKNMLRGHLTDALVDASGLEADIVIVGSVSQAMDVMQNTKETVIVITPLSADSPEAREAKAFIPQCTERVVKFLPYINSAGEPRITDSLSRMIAERAREES